tara:strand:- start:3557 stop:4498 length:942 start_codon:yes stop_codon:yes gene_type:complete
MAPYGKLKSNTLTFDIGSGDTDVNVSLIPPSTNPLFNGEVRFADSDASHYTAFKSPATVTTNVVWTLPATDSTGTQFLKSDGSGNLGWASDVSLTLIDEDDMASDSATAVPSQQSVKAYVDAKEGTTIKSTGESGGTKFLREDGDGSCSWQDVATTTIPVADESTDTTCNVVFTTAATGDQAPKTNTGLTFDSATGTLNANILTQKIGGVQWDVKDVYWGGTNSNMNHDYSLRGRCYGIGGTSPIVGGGWSAGNTLSLINTSNSDAYISESGCTIYLADGSGSTGTRTLAKRGMCTLYWVSSTVAYISGGGLS